MQETTSPTREGFTGYTLKLIAVVTMFIDHIGAVLIENGIFKNPNMDLTQTFMGITQVKLWGYLDFALLFSSGTGFYSYQKCKALWLQAPDICSGF